MNILILGSEGQIGKPLMDYLVRQGHTVVGWDKKMGHAFNLEHHGNMYDLEEDMKLVDKVIFLAFEVGGSKYLERADKDFRYIQENTAMMANVFEVLQRTGKPFLFASSQMANMHHTNYGFLKDLGERYTRSLGGWICRFWNVYGVENCEPDKRHVITDFLEMAESGTIRMRTEGRERRQFLHTDDCNRAIESWVDGKWDDPSEYYDITSFEWFSIEDVAKIIQTISEDNVEIYLGQGKDQIQRGIENDPSRYILNFWQPELSLSAGIRKVRESL